MRTGESEFEVMDLRPWVWSAFACGALTGAFLAVMFAPARGRDTRRKIVRTARDSYRRTAKAVTRNRRAVARQKKRVGAFIDKAKNQVDDIRTDVAGAVRDAKSAFGRGNREALDR